MSTDRGSIGRVVDLLFFVPIGAAVLVASTTSTVMRSAVARRSDGTNPMCRRTLQAAQHNVAPPAERGNESSSILDEVHRPVARPTGDATSLAIDGYDHLAARQVVDRLSVLSHVDLLAIESYERANRRRQTVLGMIEHLLGPSIESRNG
jgi:hypothetical protein